MPRAGRIAAAIAVLGVLAGCSPSPAPAASTPGPSAGVSPVACTGSAKAPSRTGDPADWPTYHHTPDRAGVDLSSPPVGKVGLGWRLRLDGALLGAPLIVGTRVIVATEADSVYALDARTGCVVWRTSVGTPVRAGRLPCPQTFLGGAAIGITATPVVDVARGLVHVAAYVTPTQNQLVSLSLADGRVSRRVPIDPPDSDPNIQLTRGALALDDDEVVATMGGRAGDCGEFHGEVVAVRGDGSVRMWRPSPQAGGIWQPGGAIVLAGGDLLVAVGNGHSATDQDGGNSVVRLSRDLTLLDSFAPVDAPQLNRTDSDLGSTTPVLIDESDAIQLGKAGIVYLLDPDELGGVGGQHASLGLERCYAIGGTAVVNRIALLPCDHGLAAVEVDPDGTMTELWRGPDHRAGSPIVAGGAVWTFDFEGGVLYALDLATGQPKARLTLGIGEHFVSPAAARGRLYLGVGHDLVQVTGV